MNVTQLHAKEGGMDEERFLAFARKLATKLPKNAPDLTRPDSIENEKDSYRDFFVGFTLLEFRGAYKALVMQGGSYPSVSEILEALVAVRAHGTPEEQWERLQCMIEEYKRDEYSHRTCDELLARTIKMLGGLDTLSQNKPSSYDKKVFLEAYANRRNAYVDGGFDGEEPSVVGNRLAVPVGIDPNSVVARPKIAISSEEEEHALRKAEDQRRRPTLVESLCVGKVKDTTQVTAKTKEPVEQRLKFMHRLYSVSRETGQWFGEIPNLTSLGDRLLNEIEQSALHYCVNNNKNLNNFKLVDSARAKFVIPGSDAPLFYRFNDNEDPLLDAPGYSYATPESLERFHLDKLDPEQREIFLRRKQGQL